MKRWQFCSLGLLLALMGQTGGPALTQAEKNSLLSRKKWYVTIDFTLTGNGAAGSGSWRYANRTDLTLELNNAIPGQWPSSTPPEPNMALQTGRFITWMAVPTDEAYAAIERGEANPAKLPNHYYPMNRSANETFNAGTRTDRFTGISPSFAIGPCMLAFDLKTGLYDVAFQVIPTDLGSPIRHEWTDQDRSGTGEAVPTHHLAWLTKELLPALSRRSIRSDLKPDGTIAFTLTGPTQINLGGGARNPVATATFRFSPTPPSMAKLTIEPKDPAEYAKWRPKPGPSEDRAGSGLDFKYTVDEPGVAPNKQAKLVRLTWRLGRVSRYPGVCMNWPMAPSGPPKPDLQFKPMVDTPTVHYSMGAENESVTLGGATDQGVPRQGTISVECFDGGAIGEILAEAELADGRILHCEVRSNTAMRKILIPDREEGVSDMARRWRDSRASGLADDVDDESDPVGDGQAGDGLTVWEEYRGFRQGGIWRDNCEPKRKDLFVANKVGGAIERGLMLFESATGLVLHRHLKDKEYLLDRKINHHVRADRHVVDQHCIILMPSPFKWKGNCESALGKPMGGPPKNTWKVNILLGLDQGRIFTTSQPGVPSIQDSQAVMVAHELSHGIGVYHHGESDITVNWTLRNDGSIWENGTKQITVLGEPAAQPMAPLDVFGPNNHKLEGLTIGMPQGQHSGDAFCYMRYDIASAYPHIALPSLNRIFHNMFETPGNRLCSSGDGTEVNDSSHQPHSRYFSADTMNSRGNCIHQFVISDRWEAKAR